MKKWWNRLRLTRLHLWSRRKKPETGIGKLYLNPGAMNEQRAIHASPEQQEAIHQAIRWYGRRKLHREIDAVHRRLIVEQPEGTLARQLRRIFPVG